MDSFTPTERSRVRRMHERGHHDRATVHGILDAGVLCHVGYTIDGQPYVTPTAYWREGDTVYWHGSSASRMLRTAGAGVPVCLTVTHLDGFVLARSGFHHSMNYRSVMLFGRAEQVEDRAAKQAALRAFLDRMWPGRADALRPDNAQELKATMVLRMPIEEASAKIRTGPPKDDDEDYALPVWAGVIPVRQLLGEPVADPKLRSDVGLPTHVRTYRPEASLDAVLSQGGRGA
jgi:nitroimidazol reductase NimA-like FMN-containing flavoprotein (pyridoxamine 5'-phosphate oxidase superfamily)